MFSYDNNIYTESKHYVSAGILWSQYRLYYSIGMALKVDSYRILPRSALIIVIRSKSYHVNQVSQHLYL